MTYSTSWKNSKLERNFTKSFAFLINHRGTIAEQQLVEHLSVKRFADLLDGHEPTFREVENIAKILGVPLSSFQLYNESVSPELEIAFAEIMYESCSMSKIERESLAEKIVKLIHPDSSDVINILQFQKRK
ncbi:MAG: hypothetical protein JKY46_04985 [Robiginitomaculum sp.]|nr:hypothetical protein [Robiginitomaculum sp.]